MLHQRGYVKRDVCQQAGFIVNFGGLGCRRAEDIALLSFLASINTAGELVKTNLSRINIADTNELAEVMETWRRASGGAPSESLRHSYLRKIGKICLSHG